MIQRIQTLYIVLGSVLHFFLFSAINIDGSGSPIFWLPIQLFCIVLALAAIFSYNNRKRQINLLYMLVGIVFIYAVRLVNIAIKIGVSSEFTLKQSLDWSSGLLDYFIGIILAIIFYILAIKRIKKDDNLIKSIDRIR